MSFKSKPAALGTGSSTLFTCPAATEAAVIVGIANTTNASKTFSLAFYDAVLATSFDLATAIPVAANTTIKFPFPIAMEAGDYITAVSSASGVTAFVTVTQGTPGPQFKGLVPQGAYNAGTTYAEGDVVSSGGSTYVSRVDANVGNTPASSTAEWMLLASKGDTGAAGTDGSDGADGSGVGDMLAATYDPNGHETDTFAMANMVEDGTHKVMTGTERTKLSGVATSADVTAAGNVGAAIHGTSAKSSLVDADEVAGGDSASSFSLIRSTWTNVKAFLKTYFDTLYAAVSHTHAFSTLTSKPTSLSGYGITDAMPVSGGTFTGTVTLAADPSSPLHAATKQYADGLFATNDAMIYKGAIDASTNPNYPAADAGHTYRISVAGKIGGASGINVEAGDWLTCNTDSTASGNQATVGTKWNIVQANIDGAYYAGGTDVALADGGTGSSTAAGARTNLGLGTIAVEDEATAAQYLAATASKALAADKVWAAGAYTGLTDGTSIAVDMATGINFSVTLGGNRTFSNPTNTKVGQSGVFKITQDGTGSRTGSWGSNFKGTVPTLSTAASAVDIVPYYVDTSTRIVLFAAQKGV